MLPVSFERITSLHAVAKTTGLPGFTDQRVARFSVAWAEALPEPLALLADDARFIDPWVGQNHGSWHSQASRDISCYFCRDLTITGRGHMFIDNALILSDEFVPNYWRDLILNSSSIDIAREFNLKETVIEEPTLIFSSHGVEVYGHFIIETMFKLMVARRALGPAMADLKVLLQGETPAWLVSIYIDTFKLRPEQFIRYDSHHERVLLKQAIVPTLCSFDGWFHPFARDVLREVAGLAGPASASIELPRVFMSRALHAAGGTGRRCLNEQSLLRIAAREFGFAVISAETLPWPIQIGVVRHAEIVVGEFGSSLHTAIFAPSGTIVGSIGIGSMAHSMIGALCGHRNAYLRVEWNDQNTVRSTKKSFASSCILCAIRPKLRSHLTEHRGMMTIF